jgi:hypothetical protein
LKRRPDECTLLGHVCDVRFHIARVVGALPLDVPIVKIRTDSGQGLGLERMQDQVPLGRKVVVQAAETEVAALAACLMLSRRAPYLSISRATARKISCCRARRSSRGRPGFRT